MSKPYEVIDHGIDNCQYFQGCGTAFTDFDICFTGAGSNAREAYHDALDQAAMSGYNVDSVRGVSQLSRRVVRQSDHEDIYYYVSIRLSNALLITEG